MSCPQVVCIQIAGPFFLPVPCPSCRPFFPLSTLHIAYWLLFAALVWTVPLVNVPAPPSIHHFIQTSFPNVILPPLLRRLHSPCLIHVPSFHSPTGLCPPPHPVPCMLGNRCMVCHAALLMYHFHRHLFQTPFYAPPPPVTPIHSSSQQSPTGGALSSARRSGLRARLSPFASGLDSPLAAQQESKWLRVTGRRPCKGAG